MGPGSCTYSCPLNYVFQAGQASTCRASHEFSGFDGVAYCRRANDPPYNIRYEANITLEENLEVDTYIGRILSADTDALQTATYSVPSRAHRELVNVTTDGSVFLKFVPNFEEGQAVTFSVRVTDDGMPSHFTDQTIVIPIVNVNERPTSIRLSGNVIAENAPIGRAVGQLSTTDPDNGQTFSYALTANPGNLHCCAKALTCCTGGLFRLEGNLLRSNTSFDFELASNHTIEVEVTDSGEDALSLRQEFVIQVTNVNEAPTIAFACVSDPCITLDRGVPVNTVLGVVSSSDPDAGTVGCLSNPAIFSLWLGSDIRI